MHCLFTGNGNANVSQRVIITALLSEETNSNMSPKLSSTVFRRRYGPIRVSVTVKKMLLQTLGLSFIPWLPISAVP